MAIYDAIGGMETCRRLARAFYARVQSDSVLLPVYGRSLHCVVESLSTFLAQHFGGPCEYSGRRWSLSLYEAHLRFKIGQAERDAWVKDMTLAMEDVGIGEPARADHHIVDLGDRRVAQGREDLRHQQELVVQPEAGLLHAAQEVVARLGAEAA